MICEMKKEDNEIKLLQRIVFSIMLKSIIFGGDLEWMLMCLRVNSR
jgi:hypothetical protein